MAKEMEHYDAIVIGTGQAGPFLAVDLAKSGRKVAIIERHFFGGTCVNTGCIPTKTMIANARVAHMTRRAADYGVFFPGDVSVDMKRVKARKDQVSELSKKGVEKMLRDTDNCTVLTAHARFVSDHRLEAGDLLLEAESIFINVGGRAAIPQIAGLDSVPYLTNSSMMDVDYLPAHLVIIGGSYIGLEFAQMFRRFGSQVTVLQRGSRLIQREDEDVADAVKQVLENEGIEVRLNVHSMAVTKTASGVELKANSDNSEIQVWGSHLLLATGRRPNTDDLGLEHTGIQRDDRGFIQVDERLQTSVAGVWALGDCNGRGAFTHTSYNDYEIVAENLLRNGHRRVTDRITTYAIFTDPPLGRAGMTEAEVRKSGRPALIGTRPMSKVGRAVERGETQGFIKILADAESKFILGAAILGTEGDEVVHCLLDAMYSKTPYTTLQRAMHIHPTVSELIPTVLQGLKPL
jgi:pyruvate/2-oxoglutarate dehydrogenase complex dihydrolipoamide dehydrogenase (E3) component